MFVIVYGTNPVKVPFVCVYIVKAKPEGDCKFDTISTYPFLQIPKIPEVPLVIGLS